MTHVVIVGGGIAGLSVAHEVLKQARHGDPVAVTVLEEAPRVGGNLRTEHVDGFVCECGPNGFLDSVPETLRLVREVGLEPRMLRSSDHARRRFIFHRGRLHQLPEGPVAFLRSRLLSLRGKARLALEPFASSRPEGDETIHAFASRRIGREAADVLIDPMVSGVFGGNARELSLRACFPKMWDMETEHGGLVRALLARRRAGAARGAVGAPAGRLTSFQGGVSELPEALAQSLNGAVWTGARVVRVVDRGPAVGSRFGVEVAGQAPLLADAVVLAGSARTTAPLVGDMNPELARLLAGSLTAPLAVVCLGFRTSDLDTPLDGFGFLVPRGEGPRLLGALWDSSIYPGRAPTGYVLIRCMVGGAHNPSAIGLSDDELLSVTRADLQTTMGLTAAPVFSLVFRHALGIPQYTVGHLDRLRAVDRTLVAHPGLHLAGNAYHGVAINNCVAHAGTVAAKILEGLAGTGLERPA